MDIDRAHLGCMLSVLSRFLQVKVLWFSLFPSATGQLSSTCGWRHFFRGVGLSCSIVLWRTSTWTRGLLVQSDTARPIRACVFWGSLYHDCQPASLVLQELGVPLWWKYIFVCCVHFALRHFLESVFVKETAALHIVLSNLNRTVISENSIPMSGLQMFGHVVK